MSKDAEPVDHVRLAAARATLALLNSTAAGGPAPRIRVVGYAPAGLDEAANHLMAHAYPVACAAHVWEEVLVVTHRLVQPGDEATGGRFYPWETAYERLRASDSASSRVLLATPAGALSLDLATVEALRDGYMLDGMPYVASKPPTAEQARQGYIWVVEAGGPGISTNDPADLHLEEPLRSMLLFELERRRREGPDAYYE